MKQARRVAPSASARRPGEAKPAAVDVGPTLRFSSLPTFKLDMLSSLTARHGELLYQRLVGLRTVECRILGVVAHFGPVTLKEVCAAVGIDKGQGSRLVTQLLAVGLLDRRDGSADQRSFHLLLTSAGRQTHARIAAAAAARNERWLEGLPEQRRALFVECLDLLTRQAQQMLAEEGTRSRRGAWSPPSLEAAGPAADIERPVVVSPAALRDLQRRLGELLGDTT